MFAPFSKSGAHCYSQVAVLFKQKSTIWEDICESPQEGTCSKQLESEKGVLFILFVFTALLAFPHTSSCEDF